MPMVVVVCALVANLSKCKKGLQLGRLDTCVVLKECVLVHATIYEFELRVTVFV